MVAPTGSSRRCPGVGAGCGDDRTGQGSRGTLPVGRRDGHGRPELLAALALLNASVALALTSPFDENPGAPIPSVSVPAAPAPSESARPAEGGGRTPTRCPGHSTDPSPSTTQTGTHQTPAGSATTTTPTNTSPTADPTSQPPTSTPPTGQPPSTMAASAFRGNDLATLVVGVPALALGLIGAIRRSLRAHLVWIGMLAYSIYNLA